MLLGTFIDPIELEASLPNETVQTVKFPVDLVNDCDYLVVYFYPADFTSICPTELLAFHSQMAEFDALKTAVAAVSCNTPFSHSVWKRTPKSQSGLGTAINHAILADPDRRLAKVFDVLLPTRNLATRGLFVLSREGEVLFESRHDTKTARNVSDVVSIVRDLAKVHTTTGKRIRVDSI